MTKQNINKKLSATFALIAVMLAMVSCSRVDLVEMKPVDYVDLNQFMGKWYVIANIPTFLEKKATNAVEFYSLREDGNVDITFSFHKNSPDGKFKEYSAVGFVKDTVTNSEWRVQFFWPIKFPYLVLDLAPDYSYTVVGVPNRKWVWIMARDTRIEPEVYEQILNRLKIKGYDTAKIRKVPQDWGTEISKNYLKLENSPMKRKKIAIVGTGISGLTCAWLLNKEHDITVFEAKNYVGGHTNTVDVEMDGFRYAIDTGFIVYNERTYPQFSRILNMLGVETQPAPMSFSVKNEKLRLEYNGGSLNSLFAQRSNILKPSFYRMIWGIARFNRESRDVLDLDDNTTTLGEYLGENNYPSEMIDHYIIPMGGAIWSTDPDQMMNFPAKTFIRFFLNHGLLDLKDRPQWRTIKGGSREYVKKMTAGFENRILTRSPVKSVKRINNSVEVTYGDNRKEIFDEIILASHSNQSLELLADASEDEKRILGAIPYQENLAVLHTDTEILPKRKLAWASWNTHTGMNHGNKVALTYNMNILQNIESPYTFNVTLNRTEAIDQKKIIKTIRYEHPLFTVDGIRAQRDKYIISGKNNTWYAGAYWRYGFHEDGVISALDVCRNLGVEL